jgi:hypothetical protein
LIFAKNKETDSEGRCGASEWHGKVVHSGEKCHNVGWSTGIHDGERIKAVITSLGYAYPQGYEQGHLGVREKN